jgi:hypothetical protein
VLTHGSTIANPNRYAPLTGDVFGAASREPIEAGRVETDDITGESGPEAAQQGCLQMNPHDMD